MRYKWYGFRKRFNKFNRSPVLNYNSYWRRDKPGETCNNENAFRFTGGFESITDGQILWIRGDDLTLPVYLKNAETYMLPARAAEGAHEMFDPGDDTPDKINWGKVSMLTEGARVFVGGSLSDKDGRPIFASTKENPLIVIFYEGPDESLTERTIRTCRHRREYWNPATPYSLAIGALCLLLMAFSFLSRPAYRLTVIVSIIALFIPLYPVIPPGLLLTAFYRRLSWRSRSLRAMGDLARLPENQELHPEEKQFKNSSRLYTVKAYSLEAAAWIVLFAGIGLNIFFLRIAMVFL